MFCKSRVCWTGDTVARLSAASRRTCFSPSHWHIRRGFSFTDPEIVLNPDCVSRRIHILLLNLQGSQSGLAAISSQSFFPPFSEFSCHNLFLEDSNVTWQNEVSAWSFRENNLIFNSPWTLCSPVMPTSQPLRCPLVPGSEEEKKGKAQGQLCFLKRSIASLK